MTLAVNIAQGGSNNVTMRNRIINGNMLINQRGASTVTVSDAIYPVDRYTFRTNMTSKATGGQSSTAPAGFQNSILATSTSAYTPSGTDFMAINHRIEGYNVADLGWGTANAKTITVSFWVQSSVTGTFSGTINNSAIDRSYGFTYVISSANTWTYISATIPGDTSGTWNKDNSGGIYVFWNLGCGSTYSIAANTWTAGTGLGVTGTTSLVATNGATFYITGVQLEAGTTASPFEYRQYGTELLLCMRYFQLMGSGGACGTAESGTRASLTYLFPVPMRAAATGTLNASNGYLNQPQGGPNAITDMNNFFYGNGSGTTVSGGWLVIDTASNHWSNGKVIITSGTQGMIQFSAEL